MIFSNIVLIKCHKNYTINVTKEVDTMNFSISNKILNRMNEAGKGIIFTNSDFYDLGNADAIRKSLSRLCEEKKIYRLIDGYYTIPHFIEIIHEYSYPSTHELAQKIADKYYWNISAFGETALNQVGLSTQVPTICEYISDGPYREYEYLGTVIRFKHTSNRNISKYSKSISLLIQSIKAIGKENITNEHIKKLSEYGKKYVNKNLLNETKSVPLWIYEVLRSIEEVGNE